jgi:hypothetical protein
MNVCFLAKFAYGERRVAVDRLIWKTGSPEGQATQKAAQEIGGEKLAISKIAPGLPESVKGTNPKQAILKMKAEVDQKVDQQRAKVSGNKDLESDFQQFGEDAKVGFEQIQAFREQKEKGLQEAFQTCALADILIATSKQLREQIVSSSLNSQGLTGMHEELNANIVQLRVYVVKIRNNPFYEHNADLQQRVADIIEHLNMLILAQPNIDTKMLEKQIAFQEQMRREDQRELMRKEKVKKETELLIKTNKNGDIESSPAYDRNETLKLQIKELQRRIKAVDKHLEELRQKLHSQKGVFRAESDLPIKGRFAPLAVNSAESEVEELGTNQRESAEFLIRRYGQDISELTPGQTVWMQVERQRIPITINKFGFFVVDGKIIKPLPGAPLSINSNPDERLFPICNEAIRAARARKNRRFFKDAENSGQYLN